MARRPNSRTKKPQPVPPGKIVIRLPGVEIKTGLPAASVYEMVANGSFPKPIPLGPRRVGWVLDEVEAWIAARIATRGRGNAA